MSDDEGTWAYLQSRLAKLAETAPDAIAMLGGRLELDPIFLLDACATAGLLEHADLPAEAANLRDDLYAKARSRGGRDILALATADLDLGPSLDLDPSGDMVEQGDRLARLAELAGLATVVDDATRARLQDRLDHNAALVLAYGDSFDPLWAEAAFLRDAIPAPKTHLAKAFLAEVLNALAPELYAVDHASLSTRLEQILSSDTRTWWQRLKDKASASFAAVGDFLSVPQGVTAFASHGLSSLLWPRPRLILSQTSAGELNLLHLAVPTLEWLGAPCQGITLDGAPLVPTRGPLDEASYYELPDPADTLVLTLLIEPTLMIEWAAMAPRVATSVSPAFRWRQLAPGAARAEILADLPHEPSRARRRELEALVTRLTPPPIERAIGLAHAPVVGDPLTGFPGALVAVRAELGGTAHPSDTARAVKSALAGLGLESPPEFEVTLDMRGLGIAGRSAELPALLALVSRLIGREPLIPIASGVLERDRCDAADDLDRKATIIADEAPDAPSLLPRVATPVRDLLQAAFGPDVIAALTAACKASAGTLVARAKRLRDEDRGQADLIAQSAIDAGATGLDLADAHWVRGAIALHAARTEDARSHFDAARQALDTAPGRRRRFVAEELESFIAVAELDRLRPAQAIGVMSATLARLDAVADEDRDSRWDEVRIQVAGSLARAELTLGHLDRAIGLLEESLAVSQVPQERARTLGDLGDLYRRAGRLDEAQATLGLAREALVEILSIVQRERTMRFIALFEVRAGLADPHYPIVAADWSSWPQPAEAIESLLAASSRGMSTWIAAALEAPRLPLVGLLLLRSALARAELGGATPESIVQLYATIAERLREADADPMLVALTDPLELIRTCPY